VKALIDALHERRPQQAVQIIDAHAHVGPYSLFFIPRNDSDGLVRVMDRCGVRRTILSSHLGIQLDARAGNVETARAVDRHPGRIQGYIVVNPWQDPEAEIARWAGDPRFVGIKVHPDLHHYAVTGDRYAAVWEFAERTGRPVLTHSWLGSPYDDLRQIGQVAERHPEANILVGHAGVLREGIDEAIALARRFPHLYLELCGSHGHGELIVRMAREVGAERLVYGSDFPFIDMRSSLGRLVFAALDDDEKTMVLGGTIAGLLAHAGERS
jgi:predicted TIM-barrel fold metal-dependent hydrolase